jgi:type I restriction enzyme, S subunit
VNTKLGPYPKYKDSGIPWLGQIPEHWDVRRNGRLFAQRNETGFGELPILEVSLRTGVRVRDMDNLKRKQVMSDAEKYKRAAKGDIAYNMMRMWQGALGTAPVDGLVSPAYVVARPFEETNPYYYSYLFRTEGYKAEVDGYSRGIVKDRNRLYWQDFKRMPSCSPPPEEQAAIVRFLDGNAALVRQFIRNRRQLIDVLIEQKQAIVNTAVTRGLDPNAPMKSSGVDWLGDIPADWETRRLRYLVVERLKYGANAAAEHVREDWPRYIRITDFGFDGKLRQDTFRSLEPELAKDYMVQDGDVLLARSGATVGKSYLVSGITGKACHAGYLIRVRPDREKILPAYLALFLQSIAYDRWRSSVFNIATIENIGADKYASLAVPLPDLTTQLAILKQVDFKSGPLDQMIRIVEDEIKSIQIYRKRLIEDVVRGAVDILEAVDGLPLPLEDAETLDEFDSEFTDDLEESYADD